jgi:hypothetical protein
MTRRMAMATPTADFKANFTGPLKIKNEKGQKNFGLIAAGAGQQQRHAPMRGVRCPGPLAVRF